MPNQILRIDLSNRSCRVEEVPDKIISQYIGGGGLGAYLLYNSVPARADPLSEKSHLVFTAGPSNGTSLSYSSKTAINTKSLQEPPHHHNRLLARCARRPRLRSPLQA